MCVGVTHLQGCPPLLTHFSFSFSFSSGVFGRRLNVWNLSCRTLTQCFDLGEDSLPLSVKFLHNPDAAEGYVSCALSGIIYRFYKCEASAAESARRESPDGELGAESKECQPCCWSQQCVSCTERQLGSGGGHPDTSQGRVGMDSAQDAR